MNRPASFPTTLVAIVATLLTLSASAEGPSATTTGPRTRIDLTRAMNLAGENLIRMLNPKHDYLPNFLIVVEPDYRAEQQMFFMSHNIGRCIDAMERLQEATGFAASVEIHDAMLRNVQNFCDNSDDLFLRPLDGLPHDKGDLFCFHSLREQLAALHALAKYRDSESTRLTRHRHQKTERLSVSSTGVVAADYTDPDAVLCRS